MDNLVGVDSLVVDSLVVDSLAGHRLIVGKLAGYSLARGNLVVDIVEGILLVEDRLADSSRCFRLPIAFSSKGLIK